VNVFTLSLAALVAFSISAKTTITWAADLNLKSLSDIGKRLDAAQQTPTNEPLRLVRQDDETTTVTTCSNYLAATRIGFFPRTTFDAMVEHGFVKDCYVLRDLRHARAAAASYLPSWSQELVTLLPPVLLWGEQSSYDPNGPWSAAVHSALRVTNVTAHALAVEDDEGSYWLETLARGDFNGDGVEDLAIAGSVEAKEGSYRHTEYFVLTRCQPTGLLQMATDSNRPFSMNRIRCGSR